MQRGHSLKRWCHELLAVPSRFRVDGLGLCHMHCVRGGYSFLHRRLNRLYEVCQRLVCLELKLDRVRSVPSWHSVGGGGGCGVPRVPSGGVSAVNGSIACTDCRTSREYGEGYWSSVGAASCDVCDRHFYLDGSKCKQCPPGARCAQVGTAPATLVVEPGWFRFGEASVEFYECSDGGKAAW